MQVDLAAHHLGHIHGAGDHIGALVLQQDVLGTDAGRHIHGAHIGGGQLFGNFVRYGDDRLTHGYGVTLAGPGQFGIKEVHLRHSDEAGHENVGGMVEHLLVATA